MRALLCLMVLLPTGSACAQHYVSTGICATMELVFANLGALSFVVLIFQPELEGWALDPHPQTRSEEKRKRAKGGVHRWTSMVALLATGHVTSTLAPAFGTVAFSNIVKTAEPLFTCLFSAMLFGELSSLPV